jgi:hypothetical protein
MTDETANSCVAGDGAVAMEAERLIGEAHEIKAFCLNADINA